MLSSVPLNPRRAASSSSVRGSRSSCGRGGMRGAMPSSWTGAARVAGCVQNGRMSEPELHPDEPRRPATDFGAPGVVSHFRGPFADGPPAKALHVDTPPLDRFGVAEL